MAGVNLPETPLDSSSAHAARRRVNSFATAHSGLEELLIEEDVMAA